VAILFFPLFSRVLLCKVPEKAIRGKMNKFKQLLVAGFYCTLIGMQYSKKEIVIRPKCLIVSTEKINVPGRTGDAYTGFLKDVSGAIYYFLMLDRITGRLLTSLRLGGSRVPIYYLDIGYSTVFIDMCVDKCFEAQNSRVQYYELPNNIAVFIGTCDVSEDRIQKLFEQVKNKVPNLSF